MTKRRGLVLREARVVTPSGVVRNGYVAIEFGRIVDVGSEPYRGGGGLDELYLNGMTVGPGFIDTHIHGAFGIDLSTATPDEISRLSEELVKYGVTSFVPTAVALPREELSRFCRNVLAASKQASGARILGIHLEGPFLNPRRAGAQNPEYMRPASVAELEELAEASGGLLKSITIAPEVDGATELIRSAVAMGVVVQVGHTDATYSKTAEAVALGATKATHLYNAMSGIHHRVPGAALALLRAKSTYLELIVDFVHVAPEVVEFTVEYAGYRRVVLISDSIPATGAPEGLYKLGGLDVEVRGGIARLVGRDVLAGSTLTMSQAFLNAVSLGFRLEEAFYMASTAPAESLGLGSDVGGVAPGRRADLVVLERDGGVAATFVGGKLVYARESFAEQVG
ncbi:MAG: N-acetylglucosamine-6-phosphate deacetylase [Sulfolobales archaeon]